AEHYYAGLRDTAANRSAAADVYADSLHTYLYDNYGFSLGTRPLYELEATETELQKGGSLLQLRLTRTGYKDSPASIGLEFGGTAVRDVDYHTFSDTVNFSSGQSVSLPWVLPSAPNGDLGDKSIEIRLVPDDRQTADTTPVILTLGDGVSQTVRIEASDPIVSEDDGEASFRIWRTSGVGSLTVDLEWDGEGVPGVDFDLVGDLPVTAHFPEETVEIEISVSLVDDGIAEQDKEIVLRVLPGEGYLPGHSDEASARIIDEDRPAGLALWLRGNVEGNRMIDSSGHNRHATTMPAGRGPEEIDTQAGPAIEFDGVEATVGLPKLLVGLDGGFTVAFRIRIDASSFSGEQNILSFGARGEEGSLNIYMPTASVVRTWVVGGEGSGSPLDVVRTWTDGVWRHYALSIDDAGVCGIFVDGELLRSSAGWTAPLDPDEMFWLGWRRQSGNSDRFFAGEMRDFRVYERGLSEAEVDAVASGLTSFGAWKNERGLPDGLAPLDDPDGDGMSLLLEYAMGGSPNSSGLPPRYWAGLEGGRMTMTFLRQVTAKDLSWRIEASDLMASPWEILAERIAGASEWSVASGVHVDEGDGLVTVTDRALGEGALRRFLRLSADLTDPENPL
ncbi:MAG: LamG-like jellyroll fold domain-containing protein, partial [Opitutales bacterium]